MKRKLLLLVAILTVVTLSFGQDFDKILQSFDEELDSTRTGWNIGQLYYECNEHNDPDSGYSRLSWVESPKVEGAKALRWEYSVHNSESYGGYQKLGFSLEDSTQCFDLTGYDTLVFSYYVEEKESLPGRISFRCNLSDCAESDDGNLTDGVGSCEYYYSLNPYIADTEEPGWHEQKIAIENNVGNWDGTQFNLTTWAGVVGNQQIDKDKIKSIDFELSISGAGQGDRSYGIIYLDNLKLTGASSVPFVLFSGNAVHSSLGAFTWGQSTLELEEGTGIDGTNALKWTMGDEWSNGWSGAGYNIDPAQNMMMSWMTDSLKFGMKASEGTGELLFQFEDGVGKKAHTLTPIADGEWHDYAIKLSDFYLAEGESFDSTSVSVFQFMANGNAVAGNVVMFDYMWTGEAVIDIIPPLAATGVSGIPYASEYYNLVMWTDADGETGEVYDVYASPVPFDSVKAATVEKIASGVLEGTQAVAHRLQYPLEDHELDYYYAVVCKDVAGNESEVAFSDVVSGTAKGIPTVSLNVPSNFVADGYFDEWYDSGIRPFKIKPETNYVVTGEMADSTDLNATVWIAIDDDYLYVAADVIDDVFFHADAQDWWTCDALDFFIGLYNMRGGFHSSYNATSEPDHKMQFRANGFTDEVTSGYTMEVGSENYYFEGFNPDYVFEAKISLDEILSGGETRFHPVNGMKIPMDIYFHDNDLGSTDHESSIAWGPNNKDTAWQNPFEWSYTFIGDTYDPTYVAVDDNDVNVAAEFKLEQNYPNPFNPTTTINYALGNASMVKISVYNMLGEKVADLVNKNQQAGAYRVQWNAANMATGMYFYRLQAGDFVQTRKMLLLK